MSNVELYAKALDAIRSLAGDLSVDPEATAQNLDDLVDEISRMKASLDLDGLGGHVGPKELASPTGLPPTTLTIDGVNYIVVYGYMPDDKEAAERAVRQALVKRAHREPPYPEAGIEVNGVGANSPHPF